MRFSRPVLSGTLFHSAIFFGFRSLGAQLREKGLRTRLAEEFMPAHVIEQGFFPERRQLLLFVWWEFFSGGDHRAQAVNHASSLSAGIAAIS